MEHTNHPEYNEKFLKEPSKVVDVIEFLELIMNSNKMENSTRERKKTEGKPVVDISAGVTDTNFCIFNRLQSDQLLVKRCKATKHRNITNTSQFTFMRQIDQTREERAKARTEREIVANNFRRLGNVAFRRNEFNQALELYTKGLEYINDTTVLYLNRASCYLKLRNFNRALIECDYILTKLDSTNIRAFLYRAAAYKRLNDDKNYEESIYQVKRLNSKDIEFIDSVLEKMRASM